MTSYIKKKREKDVESIYEVVYYRNYGRWVSSYFLTATFLAKYKLMSSADSEAASEDFDVFYLFHYVQMLCR